MVSNKTPYRQAQRMASNESSSTDLINHKNSSTPAGISLFGLCFRFKSHQSQRTFHKTLALFLTFIAYIAFHMGRRPFSIVVNVLNRNCSAIHHPDDHHNNTFISPTPQWLESNVNKSTNASLPLNDNWCNWAPFDDDATANQLVGILDSAFLTSYALIMFISGVVADRMNLRYLLSLGAVLSGLGLFAFGVIKPLEIHSMTYFLALQIAVGATHSVGWPVVVTCVSNWFEPAKRGLIYGIWNSHGSLGNILGATIAGYYVERNWSLSFMVPGVIMVAVGVLLFLFLVPAPGDVGLTLTNTKENETRLTPRDQQVPNIATYDLYDKKSSGGDRNQVVNNQNFEAVSLLTALKIPGVLEYSFCLFFSKLVSYTFLYWLPRYISASTSHDSEHSAYLSAPFDVGGIIGGIVAGYLSDKYLDSDGVICNLMFILTIPSLFIYQRFGAYSNFSNITLQLLAGAFVNGPFCLITTSVSADLGNRVKNGRAMATVAAIVDGMGSLGAVIGPLFAGFISKSGDWQSVFLMLMLSDVLASICLTRITINEIKGKLQKNS